MPAARELGEKQLQLVDGEIIENMMSGLTRRLAHLQKKRTAKGESHGHDDHQEHGIITMSGSNEGATMTGEMMMTTSRHLQDGHTKKYSNHGTKYLNNNFQGVNNSIMVGGTYCANDPGIHLDIVHHEEQLQPPSSSRYGRKGKKINTYSSSSSSSSSKSDH
ncbi:uncharacterized protein [Rutidosis leptorrhynchoides]|uniref:uncharacterized protein n=1 Tax=Rutidosis leptorrhynchoides TaxID=125765 RepID=UPI003A99325B